MISHLFVYGTLLPGQAPAEVANIVDQLEIIPGIASIAGSLYDFGEYTGALLDHSPHHRVVGRILKLPNDPAVLKCIDTYEGYDESNPQGSLFNRVRCVVTLIEEGDVEAWVYAYSGDPGSAPLVEGGDFRNLKRAI